MAGQSAEGVPTSMKAIDVTWEIDEERGSMSVDPEDLSQCDTKLELHRLLDEWADEEVAVSVHVAEESVDKCWEALKRLREGREAGRG